MSGLDGLKIPRESRSSLDESCRAGIPQGNELSVFVPRVVVMAVSGTITFELRSVSGGKTTRTLLKEPITLPVPSSILFEGTRRSIAVSLSQ